MNRHLATALTAVAAALCCTATTDGDQSAMRIDPTLEVTRERQVDYSSYPFLQLDRNHLQMNGADWSELRRRFASASEGDTCFSIVYLGDSHIQADFGGAVLRSGIADEAGSAGRGLIIPFRLAGTNQPNDYSIISGDPTVSSRLLKQPWATEMPFTGIGVQPVNGSMTLHIKCGEPFDRVRLLWRGEEPTVAAVYGTDVADAVGFRRETPSEVLLDEPYDNIHLRFNAPQSTTLAGMVLSKADAGTYVHSIGNNGATYSTYNGISRFGSQLAQLDPDLVIIALGTNEAFGTFTDESLQTDIDLLVSTIRTYNPRAELMLVTPTECYRKTYRRRRGRRRATGMTVNTKVVKARDAVASYARDNGIALYDTYEVVGGTGSAARMKRASVLGRDGVHFTSDGYRLQGTLLTDALLEALTATDIPEAQAAADE